MKKLVSILLLLVAAIHLLPLAGLAGAEKLSALYGVRIDEPNLTVLMRHRAVLFGLLGMLLAWSAFQPALQPLTLLAGFASVVSFLLLAWDAPTYNAQLGRVVMADIIALVCLCAAAALRAFDGRHG